MSISKFIALFLLFAANIAAQTVISSCALNDTAAYRFKDDADRLSIRHAYRSNDAWKDSTSINQQVSNRYLKALIAVNNATLIPARDTVTRWLNIHTISRHPELREFFIAADSNLQWIKNLRNNINPCGQQLVDAAILKYGLQKTRFDALPVLPWHTVYWKSGFNFNGNPLASTIGSLVSGIYMIGGENGFNDGIEILDSLNSDFVELLYCYRWGDCIDGCDYGRYWRFRVYNDCSVAYFGTFGDQLPVWASAANESLDLSSVRVYPNPAKDYINVKFNSRELFTFRICNTLGTEIRRSRGEENLHQIDVSGLQPGVYSIELLTAKNAVVKRFVKE